MAKTLFITGVSTGFGRALAEVALQEGHKVVGTLRHEDQRAAFDALRPGQSFGVLLDVTDMPAIEPAVAKVEAEIGPIDVLVNNAGYGHEGIIEESSIEELRRQFEVNLFGAIAMIKAVLPYMRRRRRGHILNITSMAGFDTSPGLSYYHGSKYALEGMSESLGKEVKGLGIAVTAVAPGGFRTEWAGRSMARTERHISDYDALIEPLRQGRAARNGRQAGDPVKAAKAMLAVIEAKDPPAHLLLGPDAVARVRDKLAALGKEIDAWEKLSTGTNFDPA